MELCYLSAAGLQASTLPKFLRHSCYQTSTDRRIRPSRLSQSRPSILSTRTGRPTPPHFHTLPRAFLDITTCQVSPALDLLYFQLSSYRQIILTWNFFSQLTWPQQLKHTWQMSQWGYVVCKFRNAIVGPFGFFSTVILISSWEFLCIWMHDHITIRFLNATSSITVWTLCRDAPIGWEHLSSTWVMH